MREFGDRRENRRVKRKELKEIRKSETIILKHSTYLQYLGAPKKVKQR